MAWKKPLLDGKMLGFGRLRRERLGGVGQGASGRGVGCGAEGWDVGSDVYVLRAEVEGAVWAWRDEGCAGGCMAVSGHTGGKAVRMLQGGADSQVLFIGHYSQSISHKAIGHTSICLFSYSTTDSKQYTINKTNSIL